MDATTPKIVDKIITGNDSHFMSELTAVTVSRKGQALLPLKWRQTFGMESGGPCDARGLNDGKGSLLLIPRRKNLVFGQK
jgi:hypothetical protein